MKGFRSLLPVLALLLLPGCSLYAEEVTSLPEETVTSYAEREDTTLLTPGTVTVVKPEEMSGEQKSLPELLKRIPGLHVIEAKGRGAYTVASVRGSTAAEVSVFVDGALMNLASEAAVDLSSIPVENVERIEVYRGYIPARFAGAAMGGVINIITKKPTEPGGSASFGAGSFGFFKTSLSYSMPLGDGNFLFGANYEQADGDFRYNNDNNTPYTPGDDYETTRRNNSYKDADILMKWYDDSWTVRGGWKRKDRALPYGAPGADKPDSPGGANLDTEMFDFSAGRRQKSGDLNWGIRAEYLWQNKKYDDPNNLLGGWGETHNEYRSSRFTVAMDGSLPIGDNNLIEFLADYSSEKLDVKGDIISTFGGTSDFSTNSWNLQLQDTVNLNKAGTFWITPIVRYNSSDGDGNFSFAAAATAVLNDNWTIRASGGSYNRAPNLYERYGDGAVIRPNRTLEWEKGTQWDISAEWRGMVGDVDASASLSYFERDAENLIEFMMTSPRYGIYQNIGNAKIRGIELEGTAVFDPWDVMFSATWMDTENTTPGDYRSGKKLPNRPEFEGLLRVTRKLMEDRASVFAELHYTGNNYFDSAEQIKIDDLFTVGLGARYKFSESSKLVFGVDDVFNESSGVKLAAVGNGPERTLWYPLQGRRFYLTFSVNF